MKPEKFINLLVFLVATGMLVWGICGNAGWKLLGANLLTAVFFMFLYRKDDNHPGVFSFAVSDEEDIIRLRGIDKLSNIIIFNLRA